MPNMRNYWTQWRPDGKWEAKLEGSARASRVTYTQTDGWSHSRQMAAQTKGTAFLKDFDFRIHECSTYGNDPFLPKG